MKKQELEQQKRIEEKIKKQVELWDIYAKVIPTAFLTITGVLLLFNTITFAQAFWWGVGSFAVTAVTWWFWTLFTIKSLINTLQRASNNLYEVHVEFSRIKKELRKVKNDK